MGEEEAITEEEKGQRSTERRAEVQQQSSEMSRNATERLRQTENIARRNRHQ